jgi:hypothetical protein
MWKASSKKGIKIPMRNPTHRITKGNAKKSFSELKYEVIILHSSFRWMISR